MIIYYHGSLEIYWTDYKKDKRVVYDFIVLNDITNTTKIHKLFKSEKIKKVTIDGFSFYIVPKFTYTPITNLVELQNNGS